MLELLNFQHRIHACDNKKQDELQTPHLNQENQLAASTKQMSGLLLKVILRSTHSQLHHLADQNTQMIKVSRPAQISAVCRHCAELDDPFGTDANGQAIIEIWRVVCLSIYDFNDDS